MLFPIFKDNHTHTNLHLLDPTCIECAWRDIETELLGLRNMKVFGTTFPMVGRVSPNTQLITLIEKIH